jgi:hypothetical protein
MSCTVCVTTEGAVSGELFFLAAVRFAGARLALVVAVGAGAVAVGRVAVIRRAEEPPLEDLRFLDELRRFLVVPELTRCFTGVVATGVVETGAAGAAGGVAATVVMPASELLPLVGLFFLPELLDELRFFAPFVAGGFGSGVGATTVVTPVASV